jgi:hypothetical protein
MYPTSFALVKVENNGPLDFRITARDQVFNPEKNQIADNVYFRFDAGEESCGKSIWSKGVGGEYKRMCINSGIISYADLSAIRPESKATLDEIAKSIKVTITKDSYQESKGDASNPDISTDTNMKFGYRYSFPNKKLIANVALKGDTRQLNTESISQLLYSNAVYTGTNLDGVIINIGVKNGNQGTCYKPSELAINKPSGWNDTVVIKNGITYHADFEGDAAMGHTYNTWIYRTFHNNLCYELSVNASSFNQTFFDADDPKSKLANYQADKQVLPLFNQVVDSFEFIK